MFEKAEKPFYKAGDTAWIWYWSENQIISGTITQVIVHKNGDITYQISSLPNCEFDEAELFSTFKEVLEVAQLCKPQ